MIEHLADALFGAAILFILWRMRRQAPPPPPVRLDPGAPSNPKSKVVRVRPRALPVVLVGLAVAQLVMWPWTAEAQVRTGPRVPSNCTDAQVLGGQADGSGVECQADATGIGGSTGSTDNAILRADGTGGATAQSSGVTIDDNNRITTGSGTNGGVALGTGGARIADSNSDGRWDFINSGGTRMDLVNVGSYYALRLPNNGRVSAVGIGTSNGNGEGFVFAGGGGTSWKAEGASGAFHQIGWAQGDYTASGISRGLRIYRSVEVNTAGSGTPNALTEDETWRIFSNEGVTAKNYHALPTAAAGLTFTFVVQDADGIRVVANTADTVRVAASVSATAGYCESTTIGDSVTFAAINATEWVAVAVVGAGWACT